MWSYILVPMLTYTRMLLVPLIATNLYNFFPVECYGSKIISPFKPFAECIFSHLFLTILLSRCSCFLIAFILTTNFGRAQPEGSLIYEWSLVVGCFIFFCFVLFLWTFAQRKLRFTTNQLLQHIFFFYWIFLFTFQIYPLSWSPFLKATILFPLPLFLWGSFPTHTPTPAFLP